LNHNALTKRVIDMLQARSLRTVKIVLQAASTFEKKKMMSISLQCAVDDDYMCNFGT